MSEQISPLPWKTHGNPLTIDDANGIEIIRINRPWKDAIYEQEEATIAHIVRCVNAHAGLVEALKLARPWIKEFGEYDGHDAHAVEALDFTLTKIDNALAALAQAKGEA